MTCINRIAFITPFLLMTVLGLSQTLYPKKIVLQKDTVIAITVQQMDSISSALIRLKELPALYTMLLAQNKELEACNELVKKDAELIDTLKSNIASYVKLSESKEAEKAVLAGLLKQQKKQTRRVKMLTGVIITPISFIMGGIVGLIIAR